MKLTDRAFLAGLAAMNVAIFGVVLNQLAAMGQFTPEQIAGLEAALNLICAFVGMWVLGAFTSFLVARAESVNRPGLVALGWFAVIAVGFSALLWDGGLGVTDSVAVASVCGLYVALPAIGEMEAFEIAVARIQAVMA